MNKYEFLTYVRPYIDSLCASCERLSRDEWRSWIKKECVDYDEDYTDEQIDWIIEELDGCGLVVG